MIIGYGDDEKENESDRSSKRVMDGRKHGPSAWLIHFRLLAKLPLSRRL